MIERLEEIFSELYIECINEGTPVKKPVEKKAIKRQNNKKIKGIKKIIDVFFRYIN